MTTQEDIALEEQVVSILSNPLPNDAAGLDPHARRQAAVAAIGRQVLESSDARSLKREAAALLAESLAADYYGMVEGAADAASLELWRTGGAKSPAEKKGLRFELPPDPGASLAVFALEQARLTVSSCIADDTRFHDKYLAGHQIESGIVCPLQNEGRKFGAIGIFRATAQEFTPADVLFVESITGLVAATLGRKQAQAELHAQRRIQSTLVTTVGAIVLELTPDGKILTFNPLCQRLTGFSPRELEGRSVFNALLVPEDLELVRQQFERVHQSGGNVEFESQILTKTGDRRRVSWSFAAVGGEDGSSELLIGTGIDITEQSRLEEELERSRRDYEQTKDSLDKLLGEVYQGEDVDASGQKVQAFAKLAAGPAGDRRKRPRRKYPYLQAVAPIVNGKLPRKESFRQVRCRDISGGGFSFLSSVEPLHRQFVVAFGAPPNLIYISAETMHVTEIHVDGEPTYVIGCRFVKRVEYQALSQSSLASRIDD